MRTRPKILSLLLTGALLGGCATQSAIHEQAASGRSPVTNMRAPDFALPNQDGKDVRLSDHRGQWVVLYFYPKDMTPGCACEATEFTDIIHHFKAMNATVYGISTDSQALHKAFIREFKLDLDLLSDPDHTVMQAYGAWVQLHIGKEAYPRVIRSTFVIGPGGLIRYHWPEVIPEGHAQRVREVLARLQAANETPETKASVHDRPRPGKVDLPGELKRQLK